MTYGQLGGGGFSRVSSNRASVFSGQEQLITEYNVPYISTGVQGQYWLGQRFKRAIGPLAGLQWTRAWRPNYSEEGGSADAFDARSEVYNSIVSELGVIGEWGAKIGNTHIVLEPKFSWKREFGDHEASVRGIYQGDSTRTLVSTNGGRNSAMDIAEDSFSPALGLIAPLGENTLLRVQYEADISSTETNHNALARLTVRW